MVVNGVRVPEKIDFPKNSKTQKLPVKIRYSEKKTDLYLSGWRKFLFASTLVCKEQFKLSGVPNGQL